MKKRAESRGPGGYTRITKLADRRLGDASPLAILQLVAEDDKPRPKGSDKTERKRRARVKYARYAGKPAAKRGRSVAKPAKAKLATAQQRTGKSPAADDEAPRPKAGKGGK